MNLVEVKKLKAIAEEEERVKILAVQQKRIEEALLKAKTLQDIREKMKTCRERYLQIKYVKWWIQNYRTKVSARREAQERSTLKERNKFDLTAIHKEKQEEESLQEALTQPTSIKKMQPKEQSIEKVSTYDNLDTKENNQNTANTQDFPFVNWFETEYKQRSKLIPIVSQRDSKTQPLKPVRVMPNLIDLPAEKPLIEKVAPIQIEKKAHIQVAKSAPTEEDLQIRLDKYQHLLDEFNLTKIKLKKLKAQALNTSQLSSNLEIIKMQTKLQDKKLQIQFVLQEITSLKEELVAY